MDVSKIKYFLVLADTLNYTQASKQLFISQSMLSRHIMSLEEELGVPLFVRSKHGVSLTSAGNYLKKGLRNVNDEYDMLLRQARIISNGQSGELRIGVINGMGLLKIRKILAEYEKRNSEIHIALSIAESPGDMIQKLLKHHIDFGLGMVMNPTYSTLATMPICTTNINIVMSVDHPLAKESSLSLKDFRNEQFITPVDDISTAHGRLVERCASVGFVPNVTTVPDIITVLLWVELNRGVTFLHDCSIANGNPSLAFRLLNDIPCKETHNLYWNTENMEPKHSAFLEFVRDYNSPIYNL